MRRTKGGPSGPSGGHRTRGFVPHPWKKCRQCWHRVDPRLIHHAPAGEPECGRAYRAPDGPAIYEKHQGGEPCCPGPCDRDDWPRPCGRCADRLPEQCQRPDRCGRCEDRCPPVCSREDACGRCKDKTPRACRRPDQCGRCGDKTPGVCKGGCGKCSDRCDGCSDDAA